MVFRAGAGPRGCPIADLTVEVLTQAFQVLQSPEIKANVCQLSEKMNQEHGVAQGINSFLANLPVEDMLCEVSLFRKKGVLASVYCETCSLRMSREVDVCIHRIEVTTLVLNIGIPFWLPLPSPTALTPPLPLSSLFSSSLPSEERSGA
jgi:hypothetical protein